MRLLIAFTALIMATCPAIAGLSVCNRSATALIVAYSHFEGKQWVSKGWRHLEVGKCSELIAGPLNARYYYFFATDGNFNTWEGSKYFCINPFLGDFSIPGGTNCNGNGLARRGFVEVDTGNQLNWTHTFSNSN